MSNPEYTARINRVTDHIERHLDRELTLEELAGVAHFSPFHFHRIFSAMTGETLGRFILRLRLEKAAALLIYNRSTPVTVIALDCGFSSPATFARAFRKQFGASASEWRSRSGGADRKEGKTVRNHGQTPSNDCEAVQVSDPYLDPHDHNLNWRIEMKGKSERVADVEVRTLEPMHVAYLRHVGPYAGDAELFGRLWGTMMRWAGPRGLLRGPATRSLTIYHDDPEITDEEKLRISVCITVPEDTAVDGEFGKMTIPGGEYAIARFQLAPDQYADAWNAVYGGWLPQSGYQPDDRPAFEQCLSDPKEHPEHLQDVAICVPVRPL